MAKNGERDRAQRMLDQLKDFLDNAANRRKASRIAADDQQMSQEEQALDEMSELLRKELELRDDTQSADRQHQSGKQPGQQKQGQGQGQQGQQGQQDQQGQEARIRRSRDKARAMASAASRSASSGFASAFQELGRKLGKMGSDEATKSLGDAGREMRDAEGALGEGDPAGATGSEGRAIEAMRKGMNSLNDQLAQQQQQQGGQQGLDGRGRGRSRMAGRRRSLGRGVDRAEDEEGADDQDNGPAYGRNGLSSMSPKGARNPPEAAPPSRRGHLTRARRARLYRATFEGAVTRRGLFCAGLRQSQAHA